MYSKVLNENFIEEYKSNHKILFRELNIMLSDIAFLNECILHQDLMFDTSIIIVYLFKNTFEYLILKVYRIMFDRGVDVLTIDTFANQIIKNLKDEEFKSNLIHEISQSSWKSDNIKAVKRRVNESVGEFRDKAIAHKLTKNMKDYSVDLSDISVLLDAAINIFNTLSFYPLNFYNPKITKHSYIAERLVVQEKSKQLLDLLFFSSRDIKKINVQFRDISDKSSILKIENIWNKYNKEHMEQEKCSKLLLNSKISNWTIVSLLQIEEFKSEILKYEKISDEEIIKIVYMLKHQFAMASDNNALDSYKLSIIDSCIENICQANVNNLNSI